MECVGSRVCRIREYAHLYSSALNILFLCIYHIKYNKFIKNICPHFILVCRESWKDAESCTKSLFSMNKSWISVHTMYKSRISQSGSKISDIYQIYERQGQYLVKEYFKIGFKCINIRSIWPAVIKLLNYMIFFQVYTI